ncbi:phosphocholine-specific phospholipase C [Chromobacterium haemolyticum]|uniref:phosphocholine-specific phospholipase C n=1 Tax=Chromobacterium haemolyticum TaxID=394935 RepID=UPI0009D91545|nr:phospholipase C, phosphocholine-specific [Chromobacterium haemolyticum]OQS43836.1 phospholipase C, phosphocholine-specific [Chromobacterium haemolyticum]
MTDTPVSSSRRQFIKRGSALAASSLTLSLLPASIQRALAIPANNRTGTLQDVEHIVILTQENRAFDHYFGSLAGVRGFGDRFPLPLADSALLKRKTVWYQTNQGNNATPPRVVAPFHLNTAQTFAYMRVEGTPHVWSDAQYAWGKGAMNAWPTYKQNHSMGYFKEADLPFQYALANAFTLCDAYHCAFQGGTNPNRVFLWCGGNDPLQQGKGPVIANAYDSVDYNPKGGYTFTTYAERLEAAGVSWKIYQDMADNFTDNPVAGFRSFRAAYFGEAGAKPALKSKGLSTWTLEDLRQDVLANRLPQVCYIVATADGSEHPGPSSPAQGADYTARVLDALTANPEVWSKTVFLVNFDENDGFFDHVPPPAAPSYLSWDADPAKAVLAGGSTVATDGEYHHLRSSETSNERADLIHVPYGPGPRVPMYVISPWSRGGWVNSQVFDHTSVIRFIEQRFGVKEPNISAWRRAVCGDLLSCFDFVNPNAELPKLPATAALAARARALPGRTKPSAPALPELPVQSSGLRRSRALPYELHASARVDGSAGTVELIFANSGQATAVFHVYDRRHLDAPPRRYAVEAGKQLSGLWRVNYDANLYDLWVLGPNGFHRHFTGDAGQLGRLSKAQPEIQVCYDPAAGDVYLKLHNSGRENCEFQVRANAYAKTDPQRVVVGPQGEAVLNWPLKDSYGWYDVSVSAPVFPGFSRRFAGRVETGRDGYSDPAMGGAAVGEQWTPPA